MRLSFLSRLEIADWLPLAAKRRLRSGHGQPAANRLFSRTGAGMRAAEKPPADPEALYRRELPIR